MVNACLLVSLVLMTLASSRIKVFVSCKHKKINEAEINKVMKQKCLKDFELHHVYLSVRLVSPDDFHFV